MNKSWRIAGIRWWNVQLTNSLLSHWMTAPTYLELVEFGYMFFLWLLRRCAHLIQWECCCCFCNCSPRLDIDTPLPTLSESGDRPQLFLMQILALVFIFNLPFQSNQSIVAAPTYMGTVSFPTSVPTICTCNLFAIMLVRSFSNQTNKSSSTTNSANVHWTYKFL